MPDKDCWHALWPSPEAVLRSVGMDSGMGVVDLCCGDGHFSMRMCQLVHPGNTWALDLDAKLLAEAEQVCRGCPNFIPVRADARDLCRFIREPVNFSSSRTRFKGCPIRPNYQRRSTLRSSGVDVSRSLTGIARHVRKPRCLAQPRGQDTSLRMEPEDVRALVEPAGFRLEKVVEMGPYHYAAVFLKLEDI